MATAAAATAGDASGAGAEDWRQRRDAVLQLRRERAAPFQQQYGAGRVQASDIVGGRLRLLLTDVSYDTGRVPRHMLGSVSDGGREPLVQLYGRTASGARVNVTAFGLLPYFYCQVPPGYCDVDAAHRGARFIEACRQCVVRQRQSDVDRDEFTQLNRRYESKVRDAVVASVEHFPAGYRDLKHARAVDVLRVTCSEPRFVAPLRNAMEHEETDQRMRWPRDLAGDPEGGDDPTGDVWPPLQTYESDLAYVMRFMVDKDLRGVGWLEVDVARANAGAPEGVTAQWSQHFYNATHDADYWGDGAAALALVVHHSLVRSVSDVETSLPPVVRVMSFDIECTSTTGEFPDPDRDPIITICAMTQLMSADGAVVAASRHGIAFQLGSCDAVRDARVVACATERALLEAFDGFVRAYDPDIVTGYNIDDFDLRYVVTRATALGLRLYLGRGTDQNRLSENSFSSGAYGTRQWVTSHNDGRTNFDMLTFVRREYKLSSYTLNAVASEFLNRQKDDLPYQMIPLLQRGSAADRARIASYCLTDAELVLLLMQYLMAHLRTTSMARVTGVPLSYVMDRGQQAKIFSLVYRAAGRQYMLLPHVTQTQRAAQRDAIAAQVAAAAAGKQQQLPLPPPPPSVAGEAPDDAAAKDVELDKAFDDAVAGEYFDGAQRDYVGVDPFSVLLRSRWVAKPTKKRARDGAQQQPAAKRPPTGAQKRAADVASNRKIGDFFVGAPPPEGALEETPEGAAAAAAVATATKAAADAEYKRDPLYEGAIVLEAATGFYRLPVTTLDFASLYPSIMMAHNMCFSTAVPPEDVDAVRQRYGADAVTTTPTGDCFVTAAVRKGVLPSILEALIAARRESKRKMASPTATAAEREIHNSDQLAYKVVCNSVYGATGAMTGKLPMFCIARSVTAFGRQMIELTRDTIVGHFTRRNGYEHDARIVYGDTDSVMILFGVADVATAMRMGRDAVALVNRLFIKPISLEFEKVYMPFDLRAKKQYIGGYWTRPDRPDRIDAKGIAMVRRDRCMLVKVLLTMLAQCIYMRADYEAAARLAADVLCDVARGHVDMSKLVITKSVSRPPAAYKVRQPHIQLMLRMQQRDANTAPKLGDRVPYVMVRGRRGDEQCDCAENPEYVMRHGIAVDYRWYLENQLRRPVTDMLQPVLGAERVEALMNEARRHLDVASVPTPVPRARIVIDGLTGNGGGDNVTMGAPTRKRLHVELAYDNSDDSASSSSSSSSSLVGNGEAKRARSSILFYAQRQRTCASCRTAVSSGGIDDEYCRHCAPQREAHAASALKRVREAQHNADAAWEICRDCQGANFGHIECDNAQCHHYYQRQHVLQDLAVAIEELPPSLRAKHRRRVVDDGSGGDGAAAAPAATHCEDADGPTLTGHHELVPNVQIQWIFGLLPDEFFFTGDNTTHIISFSPYVAGSHWYFDVERCAETLLLTEPPGDGYDVEAGDFEVMPNELLCLIAGRMPIYAAIELSTVCRRWRDCVFADCTVRELTGGDGDRERLLFLKWAVTIKRTVLLVEIVHNTVVCIRETPQKRMHHLDKCLVRLNLLTGRFSATSPTLNVNPEPGETILKFVFEYASDWQLDDDLRIKCRLAAACLQSALPIDYIRLDVLLAVIRPLSLVLQDTTTAVDAKTSASPQLVDTFTKKAMRAKTSPPPQLVDTFTKKAMRAKRRDEKRQSLRAQRALSFSQGRAAR